MAVYMFADALRKLGRAEWHKRAYTWGLYASYTLFAIALTGVATISPKYLAALEAAIKYYVCAFLLIRFNPLTHKRARSAATAEFDRRIAFSAGVFLLLTTTIADLAKSSLDRATTTLANAAGAVSFPRGAS